MEQDIWKSRETIKKKHAHTSCEANWNVTDK